MRLVSKNQMYGERDAGRAFQEFLAQQSVALGATKEHDVRTCSALGEPLDLETRVDDAHGTGPKLSVELQIHRDAFPPEVLSTQHAALTGATCMVTRRSTSCVLAVGGATHGVCSRRLSSVDNIERTLCFQRAGQSTVQRWVFEKATENWDFRC